MLSCAKNRKHLNAYMDAELSARISREVERHLAECAACRLEYDGLRGLAPFFGNDEVPPVPAGLSARILAAAALRQKRKEAPIAAGWGWREFLFRPWLVRGATTAALIVGLVMGAWMGWTSRHGPGGGHWATLANNEHVARTIYAIDVLNAAPRGSIEAATLALLDVGR